MIAPLRAPAVPAVVLGLALHLVGGSVLAVAARGEETAFSDSEKKRILRHTPLLPLPPDPTNRWAEDQRAIRLGHRLFFDPRLSGAGDLSCASCHDPALGFADGQRLARGREVATRHTPSLWNVAHHRFFFWDGRADSLWAQALFPIEEPVEMDGSRVAIARLVATDPELRRDYGELFGDPPGGDLVGRLPETARPLPGHPGHEDQKAWEAMAPGDRQAVTGVLVNVAKALAAYERRLLSGGSPFDRFARGLASGQAEGLAALSPAAQRGLRLFVGEGGCRVCHSGPFFSDGDFHDVGLPLDEGETSPDPGRLAGLRQLLDSPYNAAGPWSDAPLGAAARRLEFLAPRSESYAAIKTPGLRNVALSAPYMHRGQMATLEDVVRFYSTRENARPAGHHGRESILQPLDLTEEQISDLVAFLESLTGEGPDPALLRKPGE